MESTVAAEHFVTVFRTSERAVDPRTVAGLLRAAALAHPRIHCLWGARVTEVARRDGGGQRR